MSLLLLPNSSGLRTWGFSPLYVNLYNLNHVIFTALYTNLYDPYLMLLKLNHGVECLLKPQQEDLIIF
jgi:hypothetical protein